MIKSDDGMKNLTSTEHISDAKLLDKNVYAMVLRSDSPIKFFECYTPSLTLANTCIKSMALPFYFH